MLRKSSLWGISIALSWTWGLGLFFAVQFTFQFGLVGLFSFAIPNAIGLFLFGVGTNYIATKSKQPASLEQFFDKWSTAIPSVFLFYQLITVSLTLFAVTRYLFQALELSNPLLLLPLILIACIAVAIILGEHFKIQHIKYSHTAFFALLLLVIGYLLLNKPALSAATSPEGAPHNGGLNFWGYLIPICIGFLTGPWLDLQQWQRAIQIKKEQTSIRTSYLIGSVVFFGILIFHGIFTHWAIGQGAAQFAREGIDGIFYAQDAVVRLLTTTPYSLFTYFTWAYLAFLMICILTTLDSGYLALRWFLQKTVPAQKSMLVALLPTAAITSPIPWFLIAGIIAWIATRANLELEYFMVFYATYFVGYSMVGITQTRSRKEPIFAYPRTKIFAISALSLVVASLGYMHQHPPLLVLGAVIPALYGYLIGFKTSNNQTMLAPVVDVSEDEPKPELVHTRQDTAMVSEYVDDKWYIHAFKATYGDTNSVGNVYFGMYAMWVGKTRELFFNHCLPSFNLKDTSFLILTRSFEHKFIQEAREFDLIKVMIRVKSYNRKFATLEHKIVNQFGKMLGKGSQSLLFVSANDYGQLDIPQEVLTAFLPFSD